jgi:hypothetical protein
MSISEFGARRSLLAILGGEKIVLVNPRNVACYLLEQRGGGDVPGAINSAENKRDLEVEI